MCIRDRGKYFVVDVTQGIVLPFPKFIPCQVAAVAVVDNVKIIEDVYKRQDNSRFYDEAYGYHRQHMKYMEYGRYVDLPHERALPVHVIFDETTREAGSIASQWLSWPTTTEGYMWSSDNLAEIEKGWIVKADTVAELAEKIGRDPEALQATIDRYNEMCDKGVDEDFGRDPETMAKIEKGPVSYTHLPRPVCFYASMDLTWQTPASAPC